MTVAARMNRLPITRGHRLATVAVGCGLFFDFYEIFLAGVLGGVHGAQFHLGKPAQALVLSSAFLGMFVGALTLGRMADRLGRRRAFLLSTAVYSVFSLVGAFSFDPVVLVLARLCAGFGIGAEPALADTYLGDLLPARDRGRYTALAYTFGFLGFPAVGFLGQWLVPIAPLGIEGWRWMFVLGALGSVLVFALRAGLPESPRWLEAVGRTEEAEAIVRRFEAQAGTPLPDPVEPATVDTRQDGGLGVLLRPPYRRRTIMMVVLQVLQPVGYYGFGTLVPLVLVAKGYPVVQSLLFSAVTFLGYPIGSALSVPIVERIERKHLVIGSALGMAAFGIAFGSATSTTWIVLLGFGYTAVSNVFSNAFHIYQAEIFPTAVRGTAVSGIYSLSRLATGLMPFVLLPLAQDSGLLFALIAGAMVLLALDVAVLGPRTTGVALEELNSVQPS
ncbi:putative MFS transporter [Kutzneria viridogrisea]|uniref:MFS transporter n=1 Tax=Kutzneria viridogrisea TaxID=47990 RepID=A0ABR6BPS9_9PSEU|nr:putative MFS transporter [Kutzneria viridogrisea]